jgi:hypothetical protein
MASAIDFTVGMTFSDQGVGKKSPYTTGQKVRSVYYGPQQEDTVGSHEYLLAQQVYDDDQQRGDEESSCCMNGPCSKACPYIDFFSGLISMVCFFTAIGFYARLGERTVRLDQNMLIYTNRTNSTMTDAMRHFRTVFHRTYPHEDTVIQVPHYRNDIAAMSVSVYTTTIEVWGFLIWIYFWSCFFQWWRFYQSKELEGRRSFGLPWPHKGLYKPWLGPEFSRWLEYLFTSPCQAVLVSISFGFGSVDTLLGHFGMQAAMVLFGYEIEQQVKKVFKRTLQTYEVSNTWKAEGLEPQRMHHALTRNMRLYVYLATAWLLHLLIWGVSFPGVGSAPWGIGGQYYRVKHNQDANKERSTLSDMPWFVELIFWSQYFFFSLFGFVCTAQVIQALFFIKPTVFNKNQLDALNAENRISHKPPYSEQTATAMLFKSRVRKNWISYSRAYSILSITAKTILEVGFLAFVQNWSPWKDDSVQLILQKNCTRV